MASTYLQRNTSATDTGTKFTLSVWVKRSGLDSNNAIYKASNDNNTNSFIDIGINSHRFDWQIKNGSGTTFIRRRTNRLLRDTSGWYHLVARYDSTLGTASDRLRLYINGVLETSIDQDSTPDIPVNYSSQLALSGVSQYIGRNINNATQFWNGSMSHYHMCVGYSYAPTEFGETDSTTGQWKIKTSPSVSYGNNGWLILKDGNTITDQSSGSNNWSLAGGTLTQTQDNPSNNFAILNSITPSSNNNGAGGTRHFNNSGGYDMRHSTLAVTTGKYYAEFYLADMTGGFTIVGIQDTTQFDDYNFLTSSSRGYGYRSDGTKGNNNSSSSFGNSFTSGDTIGVAIDLDNNKIYFSKNGVWQNSGDPTSGATGTGSAYDIADGYDYCIATSSNDAGTDQITDVNFGNGYFNVTAVSSAGTNASGNGIFEYDVPTGFTALSTKGLNL